MASIQAISLDGAHKKLIDVGLERWARSKCPVRRYGFLMSNAAETFNARILWARRLPICSMIKAIRHVIEPWFDKRRELVNARDHPLTEEALRKLIEEVEKSHFYNVVAITQSTFKGLMPCSHAAASIVRNNELIYDYVWSYYKMINLRDTYELSVNPLPHRDEWVVPKHIASIKVLPPIVTRQAGRPPIRRHRSDTEAFNRPHRQPMKCSICHEPGHTQTTCPLQIRENNE
ncbi:hypothetical protein C2S53_004158 [Perilla frutescens var. hirtella]|uniref:Uncharacterized protein n=1 Tax=Perilla frutescens var. hirtella TaxID=608512 RepID=A0AAD4JA65_PERFH|nr:hypothetical protein C2S53_004158 [Perilla frutescens var. hirtella]